MEEESKVKTWLLWALIPICVVGTVLVTKSLLSNKPAGAPRFTEEYTGGSETPAAANPDETELLEQEPEPVVTTNKWGQLETAGAAGRRASADNTASVQEPRSGGRAATARQPAGREAGARLSSDADPMAGQPVKKQKGLGYAYGALTGIVGKFMSNPKVAGAIFNNKYVVAGFMSRDSVKAATGSSTALANYLKNPRNINQFMAKSEVQAALNNKAMFNVLATSKMVDAMMDTPGGRDLLNDPAAVAGIFAANPALAGLLTNPNMLNALMKNPKTVGMVGQIGVGQ